MVNKMGKDDNMITRFYDEDPTKTKVYALIKELGEKAHHSKKVTKEDLRKVIDLLLVAINRIEDTE